MSKIKDLLLKVEDLNTEIKARKAYAEYLKMWYEEHNIRNKEMLMAPACYEEFLNNEYQMEMVYTVHVDIWSSSHIVDDYKHIIDVKGPAFLHPIDLRDYIEYDAPYSIEEYIEPKTNTPGVTGVEIYDFDIEIIKRKFEGE